MADVATVFGWSPSIMEVWTLEELLDWRHRAKRRSEPHK